MTTPIKRIIIKKKVVEPIDVEPIESKPIEVKRINIKKKPAKTIESNPIESKPIDAEPIEELVEVVEPIKEEVGVDVVEPVEANQYQGTEIFVDNDDIGKELQIIEVKINDIDTKTYLLGKSNQLYENDDNLNKLVGVLSLKALFFSEPGFKIRDLYQSKNIISVKVTDDQDEVMRLFDKYGLVSIPVLDYQNKLVGRITIDDVVDIIREEADRDFQLATGITEKVEDNASIFRITKARLPWLIIGMLGGTLGAKVISSFEGSISHVPALAFFIPMITAMGGNVGVQSSAIVVQSLAKGNQFKSLFSKLGKEVLVGLFNGFICSSLIFGIASVFGTIDLGIVVSASLFVVIVFAAVMGTLIPLILDKYDIDPALATGPFITTLNDVLGLFIYFSIGMLMYA